MVISVTLHVLDLIMLDYVRYQITYLVQLNSTQNTVEYKSIQINKFKKYISIY